MLNRCTSVKIFAGIRLVLAAVLMVLFSGTMAFAHSGHDHAAPEVSTSYSSVENSVSTPIKASLDTFTTKLQMQPARHVGPVLTASAAAHQSGDCGSGNCGSGCCCNGPSTCGMAGFCHASVIPASGQQNVFVPHRSLVPIASSVSVSGGILFGLDRPPKA